MNNSSDKGRPSVGNFVAEEELNGAKKIFTSLLLACKNLSFYPHNHSICRNSINQVHSLLGAFLQKYEKLRFEIEREKITSKAGLIIEGVPEEGTIHFALFQVGIRWVEFLKGIEFGETEAILFILDKYCKQSAEADGDIVTAFWEAQFPHLQYEVAEFSWLDDYDEGTDLSNLTSEKVGMEQRRVFREDPEARGEKSFLKHTQVALTVQEKAALQEMIREEANADLNGYLDMLLDSLLHHREKENYNVILGVLSEEFIHSLGRTDFLATFKILHGLQYINDICQRDTPWAGPLFESFFMNASRDSLPPLLEVWPQLKAEDAGILGQVFKFFNSQTLPTFVSLLNQSQPGPLQQMLLETIFFFASKDMASLESILNNLDEKVIEKLIPDIVKLDGELSLRCLIRLTRHPSQQVRNKAIRGILSRDPARAKELFRVIDNLEEEIRMMILEQLGRTRDHSVEELLLSYLRNIKFGKEEIDYLFLCFKTLGKCGLNRSLSFLRETLFKGGFIPGFRNSVLRRGAAIALMTMNIPEAEMVLEDARRSFNPSLRMVVGQVRRELQPRSRRER